MTTRPVVALVGADGALGAALGPALGARPIRLRCPDLTDDGVLVIGMPSLQSQQYASPGSIAGHVNCKTGEGLKQSLEPFFANVFIFSMNDDIPHFGKDRQ